MAPTFPAGSIVTSEQLETEYGLGLLADLASSGSSAAMASTGTVVSCPGTEYTINNTDDSQRVYMVTAAVRVTMNGGANGLYRPLVTDGTPAGLGGGVEQFMSTIVGTTGATGGSTRAFLTIGPGGIQVVRAGGLRVSNGSATDVFSVGRLSVVDLGPT